jgi:uncharacterized protein YkvS
LLWIDFRGAGQFKDLVKNVGDRVSVFGGAMVVANVDATSFHQGIMVFVERINSNTIELNLYPLDNFDRFVLCRCVNGSNALASLRHYIAW